MFDLNAQEHGKAFIARFGSGNLVPMSGPSEREADALRLWFQVTLALHSTGGLGVSLPRKPLGMMLLAYLWTQPSQSASYADLRAACKLDDSSSLSHAIKRLTQAGYVEDFPREDDTRERELRLLKPGRDVVGQLLHAAFPRKHT